MGENWYPSKYGADDILGAMNLITPQSIVAAMSLVKRGIVYDLSHVLDQDMVVVSTLVDDNGTTYQPLEWNGSGPSGHHRSGTLIFPNLKGAPKFVTLVIRGIANVPERVFEWKIEN